MILLALVPALLTVVALLVIMFLVGNKSDKRGDDDFDMDESHDFIRVMVQSDKAYWVHENVLYESETQNVPDFDTARPIDVMTLTPKQMEALFEILDDLEKSERE